MNKHYMGMGGFFWGVGVVEDRMDPLKLGRCRVRIIGLHTQDKTKIPTDHLPWCTALLPIGSASVSGVGQSPIGPVENSWVLLFFRDGENMQDPVMLGIIPGKPMEESADPRTDALNSKKIPTNLKMRDLMQQKAGKSVSSENDLKAISRTAAGDKTPRKDAKRVAKAIVKKSVPIDSAAESIVAKILSKKPTFKISGMDLDQIKEEQIAEALISGGFLPQAETLGSLPGTEPILIEARKNLLKIQEIVKAAGSRSTRNDVKQILGVLGGMEELHALGDLSSVSGAGQLDSIRKKLEPLNKFSDFDSISLVLQKSGNAELIRAFADIRNVFIEIKGIKGINLLLDVTGINEIKDLLSEVRAAIDIRKVEKFISDSISRLRVDEALKLVTTGLGLNVSIQAVRSIISEVVKLQTLKLEDISDAIVPMIMGQIQIPDTPKMLRLKEDGSGLDISEEHKKEGYPRRDYIEEPDTNRLARGENIDKTIVKKKIDEIEIGQRDVPTARAFKMTSMQEDSRPFTEPETKYDAVYPYNHVDESESGHITEIDDTPGAERLHTYHRSGTFSEVHPDGTKVEKTMMDSFDISMRNSFAHVEGEKFVTVDKGQRLVINKDETGDGHFSIEIGAGGSYNLLINKGDINITVLNGDADIYVNGNTREWITGNKDVLIEGDKHEIIKGSYTLNVQGDLNSIIDKSKIEHVADQSLSVVGTKQTSYAGVLMTQISPAISFNPE